MERLIEDLLELAKHGEVIGTTEVVDLEETVREAWGQVQTDDATLVCEDLGTVRADRGRLRQALENLVGNAVEHGGPTVTVTVERTPGSFAIEDDGPGIPEDQQESVFERGFTTTDEGTGFGLAIVGEIVDAHGWEIRATTGEAGGARFEISGVGTE
jgi:signal transduction histidine kinase